MYYFLCFVETLNFYFPIHSVQVGESKLVLDIGRTSLQHQDAKPFTDDLILSMALSEVRHVDIGCRITLLIYNILVYIPYPYHRCLIEVYSCEDWL